MKISYIAPVLDGTGYSHAANSTILALDAAGADVAVTPVKLSGITVEPPKRIRELINKAWRKPDLIVQNYLPPMMVYKAGVKNVGFFFTETDQFTNSLWQHNLNLMDAILVSDKNSIDACRRSGVKTKPIYEIPLACDPSVYQQDYRDQLNIDLNGRYAFYNIGDYSSRKGMKELITAYLSTFKYKDNVVLVLKTYVEMTTPEESLKIISNDIQQIKASLRYGKHHQFPPIMILPFYLTDQQIYSLHQQCDCFVTCEKGAAWNIPCFDAVAFGKRVIANNWGGQMEYLQHVSSLQATLLPTKMETVFGMDRCSYPGVYASNQKWRVSTISDLSDSMLYAYQNQSTNISNTIADRFSFTEQGPKIRKVLESI